MARLAAFDLNALTSSPRGKGGYDWSVRDRGVKSGKVIAHLGDIASPLTKFLDESESIVGCVAWITSPRFVDALLGKPVSLIVNKEWALRDSDTKPASVRNRANLARLTGGLRRRDFPAPLCEAAGASGDDISAVRCVGHSPRARTANNPLMHHKFVVRLRAGQPVAVWTGSFNFTVNAESSLENAIEVHDPVIAAAYLAEWARVAAVSESLNFVAGKAAPSWSAGQARVAATSSPASPAATPRSPTRVTAKKTTRAASPKKAAVAPKRGRTPRKAARRTRKTT